MGRKQRIQIGEEWLTHQPILRQIFFRNLPERVYPTGEVPASYIGKV